MGLAISQIGTAVIIAQRDPKLEQVPFYLTHAFQESLSATAIIAVLVGSLWWLLLRFVAR